MSKLILRSVWLWYRPSPCFDRTRLDDISYLFLGKGSFTSTCKAIYESKNVCVKKLHPTLDKEHVATFSKKAEISLLRLLRMLQRKWLSQSSEWYDCGIKNTETLRGSKDISKSNIDWFSQCVLSLSSSMFVPTWRIIHTTIINSSSRHRTVSSSWTYIVFAIMWHKHIRYIANNRKKLILNTNIFCWISGYANYESL